MIVFGSFLYSYDVVCNILFICMIFRKFRDEMRSFVIGNKECYCILRKSGGFLNFFRVVD